MVGLIELYALRLGHDGLMLSGVVGSITYMAGYSFGNKSGWKECENAIIKRGFKADEGQHYSGGNEPKNRAH